MGKNLKYYINKFILSKMHNKISQDNIDLIALDFDGVLTDNKVLVDEHGNESSIANRGDGLVISSLIKKDFKIVVISTEKNQIVKHRCKKLGVECHYGIENKLNELKKICNNRDIDLMKVIYIGNDLNDKEVMGNVGYPMCPSDAHQEIKDISKIVFDTSGGNGVMREFLNYVEN